MAWNGSQIESSGDAFRGADDAAGENHSKSKRAAVKFGTGKDAKATLKLKKKKKKKKKSAAAMKAGGVASMLAGRFLTKGASSTFYKSDKPYGG